MRDVPFSVYLMVLPAGYSVYFLWSSLSYQEELPSWPLILAIVLMVVTYIFSHQINMWWWNKYPPRLDSKLAAFLERVSPFFAALGNEERQRFEHRMALFMSDKNFIAKRSRDMPLEEDIKALIAHECIRLTMRLDEYMMDHYGDIIVYDHPFATPRIESLHSIETYHEDGVLVLSREQLLNGYAPDQINIALIAAIKMWIRMNPRVNFPDLTPYSREEIAAVCKLNLDSMDQLTGDHTVGKLGLLIYAMFTGQRPPQFDRAVQTISDLFHLTEERVSLQD
ncbi:MAG: zinc-dependent peptidase [Bacteroidota bacterium]